MLELLLKLYVYPCLKFMVRNTYLRPLPLHWANDLS